MTDHNQQFDDLDRHISDRLREDLRSLFQPPAGVPPRIDQTILDQARRRIAPPHRRIIRLRWAAGIAAAAAIVLGLVLLNPFSSTNQKSNIKNQKSLRSGLAEGRADIDGSGRVDILDAFRLARHIEARGPANPQWDLNGDGQLDQADVDLVAAAAVRLEPGPQAHRGEPAAQRPFGPRPPLRVAGILPALRGRDALDTKEQGRGAPNAKLRVGDPHDGLATQGQDALATNPLVVLLGKGV